MDETIGRDDDGAREEPSSAAAVSPDRPTDRRSTADRTVAVHQPNYLPWLGYFEKIRRSDVFVLLDDVEYTSGSWINRNRIKTPDGWTWLTVPVRGSSGSIADVEIAGDDWRTAHRKSLRFNYGKAAAFDDLAVVFEEPYARPWDSLCELNVHLIRRLADRLDLDSEFVRSSSLDVDAAGCERIVRLCSKLGADRYYSGEGARAYNDPSRFERVGVALEYQSFDHPKYEQRFGGFVPALSIVDVLANAGVDGTRDLLRSVSADA
ncbi:WbqC family protein [Natronococcus jeotgali]|uniref:WbqC-like family protein n=1 Tax=Natronococcus jeotgali DSM 18795 TaxID=1227498 RepID=L9WLY8_9EURY|nr:WbqC family protein [Natronococcus jeotgali]ELY50480.1 WbqC-like family protein [Natronococcus jeotgali DSM 18795]